MIVEALKNTSFSLRSLNNAGAKYANLNALLATFGLSSSSGVVNQRTALTLSAFYNAITIICNDYAKLPKAVYQKNTRWHRPQPTTKTQYKIPYQ